MKRFVLYALIGIGASVLVSCTSGFYKPGSMKGTEITVPDQTGVRKHYWRVGDGIELYYFDHGNGAPVLVVHGGPGIPPNEAWPALTGLDGNRRFYYYHQRGCGKSTRPVEEFDSKNYYKNMLSLNEKLGIEAQLADIERIRKLLGVDRITLIGHSYGAFLATLYALEFPGNVDKMVLVSPAGLLPMPPQGGGMDKVKEGLSAEDQKAYEDFLRDYFNYRNIFSQNEKGLAALNSRYSEFYLKALQEKGVTVPDKSGDLKEAGGWMVHALYIAMGREYDHRNELKKVTAPVLVVHGENDLSPVAVSAEYADLFPNGTLVVIPGASHFSFEEQPGRFAETVGAFLND